MRQQLLVLGLGFIIGSASPALAVQPASIEPGANVPWSTVVENPFDGRIVYDRNYKDNFVFVSSWSKNGIGVTYTQISSTLVGYKYPSTIGYGFGFGYGGYSSKYRRRGFGGEVFFNPPVPIYQQYRSENVPDSISLAIAGKVYTYESGPVSPELAAALANAPLENVKIRLNWKDGKIRDTEIGRGTVRAWRAIFGQSS